MYKNGISVEAIGPIEKETFTGREIIWIHFIESFPTLFQWLFGLGSQFKIVGATDMHNCTLSLIKNSGIIGTWIVYSIIGRALWDLPVERLKKKSFVYVAALLAIMVIGCFESILLVSQLFCIMILMLFLSNESDDCNQLLGAGEINPCGSDPKPNQR